MAKEKLKVFQIYYDERTYTNCYHGRKWWTPYKNPKLTPFFENEVISKLIETRQHKHSEYFAVFSHKVKEKISFKENINGVDHPFTPENLHKAIGDADVYSFQKRRQNGNILTQAEHYHPGFLDMMQKILEKIGLSLPNQTSKIVLFNYCVARSDVYEEYYKEMLKPAMRVMSGMPELHKDAGYHRLTKQGVPTFELHDNNGTPYNHYPYHPFILERLMSVWLEFKNYTFKQIF